MTIVQDQTWLGRSDLSQDVTFMAGSDTVTLRIEASKFSFTPATTDTSPGSGRGAVEPDSPSH